MGVTGRWARVPQALRALVTAVGALFDLRDAHFYGGLLIAAAGGMQVSRAWTLVAVGGVLALVGLLLPRRG